MYKPEVVADGRVVYAAVAPQSTTVLQFSLANPVPDEDMLHAGAVLACMHLRKMCAMLYGAHVSCVGSQTMCTI